ncbi:alpha beta-hydrolase [Lecanosticta acicola]|uniref:Alpha beta-hydrolase n=1 Tax=Lecanosticta acicola TaxID=111012 RepID=A0AAI8Z606_9PEZI|nr:alpha beta-hydrolase [Lecanosticta acicola]
MLFELLKYSSTAIGTIAAFYVGLLGLLTTSWFQAHVVYLHAIQLTWFKDLDYPEVFGFLHNQVTPFRIQSSSGDSLYAWHILPVGAYQKHEDKLIREPTGFVEDISSRLSFRLLRGDPEALLVIHFHGAGGTVGSGYRCPNYRALSAGHPDKIHVLTFDYRGFGRSSGQPSEQGIIIDAVSVVEWAMNVAEIAPSRIMIYSQSLGTAVNMGVAEYYALQSEPVVFAGHILTAPFVDVATLVSTYSVAGTVPILGPLAKFPVIFNYLRTFVRDRWSTKDRIAAYVRANEANGKKYRLTILHAEDDYDIPWTHSTTLFWHAANATLPAEISYGELETRKQKARIDLGQAGSIVEWQAPHGIIREQILTHGLHDVIMGTPIVSLAVMRIFQERG